MRKSLEESWRHLESQGERPPRRPDGRPFVPESMPGYHDKEPGFFYYQSRLEGTDNSNLTLPRTFSCQTEFVRVSFANTDLSQSQLSWNEFVDCDFTGADLSDCDMRVSLFCRCRFVGATLRGAKLLGSAFEACDFTEADLYSAFAEVASFEDRLWRFVSDKQRGDMLWTDVYDMPPPPKGPE